MRHSVLVMLLVVLAGFIYSSSACFWARGGGDEEVDDYYVENYYGEEVPDDAGAEKKSESKDKSDSKEDDETEASEDEEATTVGVDDTRPTGYGNLVTEPPPTEPTTAAPTEPTAPEEEEEEETTTAEATTTPEPGTCEPSAEQAASTELAMAVVTNLNEDAVAAMKDDVISRLHPKTIEANEFLLARAPDAITANCEVASEDQYDAIVDALNNMSPATIRSIDSYWLLIIRDMPPAKFGRLGSSVTDAMPWDRLITNLNDVDWYRMSSNSVLMDKLPDDFYRAVPLRTLTKFNPSFWQRVSPEKIKLIRASPNLVREMSRQDLLAGYFGDQSGR